MAAAAAFALAAAAVAAYQRQVAIVDARLQRKVNLAVKATAFSELCRQLEQETGIAFSARRGVGDDKITLFCKDRPLRDIMRQITQVFNFTWARSGEEGAYKYELTQDLRSQLLEEELRNRDRDAALLALDGQMERYRKYADLSPEEAREKAASATGEEREILEAIGTRGWGAAQLYAGLGPEQLAALRAGERLAFSSWPLGNEQPLPDGLARAFSRPSPTSA
jgi:hypothetical protein